MITESEEFPEDWSKPDIYFHVDTIAGLNPKIQQELNAKLQEALVEVIRKNT